MNADPALEDGRPVLITTLCIVGLGLLVLSLPFLPRFAEVMLELFGPWYTAIWAISVLATIASFIGYWMMRRWGVYLYTATFVVGTLVGLLAGTPFTLRGLLVPIALIALGFVYIRRMR